MLFLINLAKPTLLLATVLADSLTTALAIVLEDHPNSPKSFTAKHAEPGVKLVDRL